MGKSDNAIRPELRKRYAGIFRTLEKYNATASVERLLAYPDVDEWLLFHRIGNLSNYRSEREPKKYRRKQARTDCRTIRDTADLIANLNDLYSVALQGESFRLTAALPDLLRNFAKRVEALPEYVAEKWEPIKVAAISQFAWYVKQKTGSYNEDDVSTVIGAFLYDGRWTAAAFHQWRTRHTKEFEFLGPLFALPHLPRPLPK